MIESAIDRLIYLVDKLPGVLNGIQEDEMSAKPSPGKWSKKEIIGHLIDSATNNHHRFVRCQFENMPESRYNQDKWNEFSYYQQMDSRHLIDLWTNYNKHLVEITKHIHPDNLTRQVRLGDTDFTLQFLINDYVEHMEHHLRQVVDY